MNSQTRLLRAKDLYDMNLKNELMSSFPQSRGYCPDGLPVRLLDELNDAVFSISGSRIWYLVRPTNRDFINACVAARLNWIRSTALIEAVVKKIIELRRIIVHGA
jgi:hypothetical protein